MTRFAPLLLALSACSDPDPTCADLRGVWRVADRGELHVTRGRVDPQAGRIDWELYPMWKEPAPAAGEAAPGVIDLHRGDDGRFTGTYRRRYQQGGAVCVAATPALLEGCTLTVQPPAAPVEWISCFPGISAEERWTLAR